MLRKAESPKLESADVPEPVADNTNPICNRYIGPTIVSFAGKSLGIAGAALTTLPSSKGTPIVAGVAGLVAGLSSGMSRYHMITKANIEPGIHLVEPGASTVPVNSSDELNAVVITAASTSDAVLEGYKTSLKTNQLNPILSCTFVLTTGYNQLITGTQANGQKWFGEQGKNYTDTWTGYVFDKLTSFDAEWITKHVIDIKSFITTLKPAIEISSQYVSLLDFSKLIGVPSGSLLANSIAISGAHAQNYAPRGYEQEIMKKSLRSDSDKSYSAWCIDKLGKVIDGVVAMGAIPLDVLSIVVPPTYVVYGSQMLGAGAGGYSLFSQIVTKVPVSVLQNPYVAIPIIVVGTAAATYSELTSLKAAWNQTITVTSQPDEKGAPPKQEKLQVGVLPLLTEKFGEIDPNDSYFSSVKKRFYNYTGYAQKNLSSCYATASDYVGRAGSTVGGYLSFFGSKKTETQAQKEEKEPLIKKDSVPVAADIGAGPKK